MKVEFELPGDGTIVVRAVETEAGEPEQSEDELPGKAVR